MSLEDNGILGIAMGTSEAGGYVDMAGNITGWLNELAFVPVDFNKDAMVDEWSGDYGCGVKYFSQDSVIKLAPAAGIELNEELSPAEKLKVVQKLMVEGDERAAKIYDTIGVYFGNTIAYYAMFYDIKHVIIMGRVTSGEGGTILLARAKEVLEEEYPELAKELSYTFRMRRVAVLVNLWLRRAFRKYKFVVLFFVEICEIYCCSTFYLLCYSYIKNKI
jgi:predicted NBD/HSP70 family sugar kinase